MSVASHSEKSVKQVPKTKERIMKKETWKTVIQVIISILTAALTAMGTTSCLGYGPI